MKVPQTKQSFTLGGYYFPRITHFTMEENSKIFEPTYEGESIEYTYDAQYYSRIIDIFRLRNHYTTINQIRDLLQELFIYPIDKPLE